MQSLIAPLVAEHDLLRTALLVLRRICGTVEQGLPFPIDDCATVLCFLREFVIAGHFRKEAESILPALTMTGSEQAPALVGEQFRDQETVRELVASLTLLWEPVVQMTDSERHVFCSLAAVLDTTCHRMMCREEGELFRMIGALPADDRLGLARICADFDDERPADRSWRTRLACVAARWI
jgi:hemerythrin-like domain-containing protein